MKVYIHVENIEAYTKSKEGFFVDNLTYYDTVRVFIDR